MINITTVKRVAYIYLVIPFILFSAGWLNNVIAIVVCSIVIAALFFTWRSLPSTNWLEFKIGDFVLLIVALGAWLFLSGIGGYSFQNWDHHSRNAVFHDLINYPWPVIYHLTPDIAAANGVKPIIILSYYFGFWLPSALIGKFLGWGIANFSLFLWTYFGIALSVVLTAYKLKISLLKTSLLIIFFSGMDLVGVLLLDKVPGYLYPHLWPPIQHLEWWAGSMQYSSFTTDLYWTYNQFVPALLIMSLFITASNKRVSIFLGGLCFFFAPFPALGMAPFISGGVINEIHSTIRNKPERFFRSLLSLHVLTFENLAGLTVGCISFLFFSTNLSAQTRSFVLPASFVIYLLFILLEGLLIWLLVLPINKNSWVWYMTGLILILAPFVNIGGSWDFMLRATIPALYILMLGCWRFIEINKGSVVRVIALCFLLLGAFTPVYEMNRSVVRTLRYDFPKLSPLIFEQYFQHPFFLNQTFIPEFDHPSTLIADDWITVSKPGPEGWATKVGNLFNPNFQILWNHDLIFNNQNQH